MKVHVFPVDDPIGCEPVTCTRSLADVPVANRPLAQVRDAILVEAGLELTRRPAQAHLYLRGDAWVSAAFAHSLAACTSDCRIVDATGNVLGWSGGTLDAVPDAPVKSTDAESLRIVHSWDFLRINEQLLRVLAADEIAGEVSPRAEIAGHLVLGEGSRVLPGVYIEGNVVIGRNCKIGPNCYLRGSTSIGDDCHIGQAVEVKNSLLMSGVSIGHLSYCGDSIVGHGTNFGAGTITANFRHDGRHHRSMIDGVLVDTGRLKFGAIIGDDVHTGIHTSIYPGRKLWPHTSTRPGDSVQYDLV